MFMLRGAGMSLILATFAVFFGMILGTLGAASKLSKHAPLRWIGKYICRSHSRNTNVITDYVLLYSYSSYLSVNNWNSYES